MSCGIYKIINTVTNKVYVGSSKDIEKRIKTHFSMLKKKNHHSVPLQNSYNLHGLKSFTFEIIEECLEQELFIREQVWIDSLDSYKNGYNASALSIRPTNKHSLKFIDQNSKHIEKIIADLLEIKEIGSSLPNDIYISCEKLHAYTNSKRLFVRFARATNIVKNILNEVKTLDKEKEYRISNVHYMSATGHYCLYEHTAKKSVIHDKFRTNNIYDQLVQILLSDFDDKKYGGWLVEQIHERVGFEEFKQPLITW